MSLVDLAVKLGKAFEGKYSTVIVNDEMTTVISQEAVTAAYTITTSDAELVALLDKGIAEDAPVTLVKPLGLVAGVVSPGVYKVAGHKMEEILDQRPFDHL